MSDYKLVPIEPTPKMKQYGGEANTALLSLTSACDYAADAYRAMVASAPAVQGEPVFMWHRGATDDESEVVDVDCACPCCVPLYASPQPAEQQPDATKLVEALEEISDPIRFMQERLEEGEHLNGMAAVQLAEDATYLRGIAMAALAAYRKQEPSHDNQ